MADGVSKIVLGPNAVWRSTTAALKINPIHIYDKQTILEILNQTNCIGLRLESRNLEKYQPSGKNQISFPNQNSYFLVGVDINNKNMTGNGHLIAAPCPDLCIIGYD
jgi:hypothetical protein